MDADLIFSGWQVWAILFCMVFFVIIEFFVLYGRLGTVECPHCEGTGRQEMDPS